MVRLASELLSWVRAVVAAVVEPRLAVAGTVITEPPSDRSVLVKVRKDAPSADARTPRLPADEPLSRLVPSKPALLTVLVICASTFWKSLFIAWREVASSEGSVADNASCFSWLSRLTTVCPAAVATSETEVARFRLLITASRPLTSCCWFCAIDQIAVLSWADET